MLFRLLSKLVQFNGDASQQIDDGLIGKYFMIEKRKIRIYNMHCLLFFLFIDDCCLLPNQIMIPQLHQANSIIALASPVLFYQSLPMQFEYGIEPEQLLFVPELNPVEGCMHSGQVVDTIHHVYLGKQPLLVKQCTRLIKIFILSSFKNKKRITHLNYLVVLFLSRCGSKAQVQNKNMKRTTAIKAWDQRWSRACTCGGIWRIHKTSP